MPSKKAKKCKEEDDWEVRQVFCFLYEPPVLDFSSIGMSNAQLPTACPTVVYFEQRLGVVERWIINVFYGKKVKKEKKARNLQQN